MAMSLDDTLHAVVQVTHEHGLPLTGVGVHAGDVQVFTDAADLRWWARWLTDVSAEACRHVIWATGSDGMAALHVSATREGIRWTVVEKVPADVAVPILAAYDVVLSEQHVAVPVAAVIALAEALGGDRVDAERSGEREVRS